MPINQPDASLLPRPLLTEDDRKLRVFFSVDVVGSTDYKTKHANTEDYESHWSAFYDNFFQDFASKFLGLADELSQKQPGSFENYTVWKLLGDEILFTAVVHDEFGVHGLTRAFYRVLCELDDDYFHKYYLRLKGAGWTAGFPIRNTEIKPVENLLKDPDYIGPDIDIGFRICKVARPGRMTVSLDLADLLAQVKDLDMFSFHHVGWETFQGVFNDQPYPILWICSSKAPYILPWEKEKCHLTKKFIEGAEIGATTLSHFIDSMRQALPALKLFCPYFPQPSANDPDEQKKMPEHHRKVWAKMIEQRKHQEGIETLEMGESDPPSS